jgi:transcriptional regulator with XRE-family HTH domain
MAHHHTPDDRSAFAERLQTLLRQKQMSPYKLGLKTGASQTCVGHWVKAETFPSPAYLTKVASVLETTLEFLEKGEANTPAAASASSRVLGRPIKPSLPDPEVIRSARSQILAACPDAVGVEIILRFTEFTVQL